jgi:hypothetical protein
MSRHLRPIQVFVGRVAELDREPMSRRHTVAEVKLQSDRDRDTFFPLSERVRKRISRSVRAWVGSGDVGLLFVRASQGNAYPIREIVGAPYGEAELVTQAVPFIVVLEADDGVDLISNLGNVILDSKRSAGQDVQTTGAALHREG